MRIALLLAVLGLTSAANAEDGEPTAASSPPTARFELLPSETAPRSPAVVNGPRSEPATLPSPAWQPIPSATNPHLESGVPLPPKPDVERRWYGWQTLVSDAISVGLLAAGVNSDANDDEVEGGMGAVGVLGYALGAPLVHVGHGHAGKALASVSMRIVAPIAGAFVGFGMADCDGHDAESYCDLDAAAEGFLLGALAAVVIDATVIANEDVRPSPPRVETGFRLVPDVRVRNDRAQVSLAGTF